MRPPLHVHILFHPSSELARTLAFELVEDWAGVPGVQGLRVPAFVGAEDGSGDPGPIEVHAAQHSLIALLVDAAMTDRITGQGVVWADYAAKLCAKFPPGGRHLALPVALDESAYSFHPDLSRRHFLPLSRISDPGQRRARLEFTLTVRALQLLGQAEATALGPKVNARVKIFVSHAKRDLDSNKQDPVRWTQDAQQDLPIDDWFDAREIREGAEFESEIRQGLESSDAMLVFLTDAWATRPWCRQEALMAKELGTPIVVVDALNDGEPRSFPYGGNTRLLRWRPPVKPPKEAKNLATFLAWQAQSRIEGERMVAAAVREALRRCHARHRLQGIARKGDVVLDVAPEAARLSWEATGSTFLYPDPPVGLEERELLYRIWPSNQFETPMERLAVRLASHPGYRAFSVSISESPDLARYGLTRHHQRLLTDEIHLYLMLAGLQIWYGGRLDFEDIDNPDNFTVRLIQLARDYSGIARDAGVAFAPICNAPPWPLWRLYDRNISKFFGTFARLERMPRPKLDFSDRKLGVESRGYMPHDTPIQRYAWSRSLTEMRQRVTEATLGRLAIGGRIEGYSGSLPGLLEESLFSLLQRKPLFLVGALGGCTQLVIDLLEQRERVEMTDAIAKSQDPRYFETLAVYSEYGGGLLTREKIAEEVRGYGKQGPAIALSNGLDDEENRELFISADPHRIVTLVLTGLKRLEKTTTAAGLN